MGIGGRPNSKEPANRTLPGIVVGAKATQRSRIACAPMSTGSGARAVKSSRATVSNAAFLNDHSASVGCATLEEAIETLGSRMADEISAETYNVFRSQPDLAIRTALTGNPVLRAALGGQVMMCRASMDSAWARYLSNVHVLPDDSKFITRVRRNLEAGRTIGELHFESVKVAVDYQVGAVLVDDIRKRRHARGWNAVVQELHQFIIGAQGHAFQDGRRELATTRIRAMTRCTSGDEDLTARRLRGAWR